MKDYSAMSDGEINFAVAEITRGSAPKVYELGIGRVIPDYCNNPADAWPIIIGNLISIEPDYEFIDKTEEEIHATGLWIAEHSGNHKLLLYVHESPLRAAMTVFLMMKDAEKGHG